MDAAGGATEDEVMACLAYLYDERNLRPGKRNGPRHFSWFVTVVGDYFRQKRAREEIAAPGRHAGSAAGTRNALNATDFERMTEAF
jgi:hypothetical protein